MNDKALQALNACRLERAKEWLGRLDRGKVGCPHQYSNSFGEPTWFRQQARSVRGRHD